MKILFVDHVFHEKTKSSEFFRTLLSRFFDLKVLYVDPQDPKRLLASLDDSAHELVVLWQMDYLAPIFLALGKRVVVVPMYDGSANMPDLHWLWSSQARFVNFSRQLHARTVRCGAKSFLVKYFKPPVRENQIKTFEKLNVLLWQRRPEHGLNLNMVERLLREQISSLHVHNTPDDPTIDSSVYMRSELAPGSYKLTTSTWFKAAGDYGKVLDSTNVFIAPRRSEGIGMAFLEAMSRGCLVFASDDATHDEYIANWVNGILINPDSVGYAGLNGRAADIGRMAWKTAQSGYDKWLAVQADLIEFIRTAPVANFKSRPDPAGFANSLIAHYEAGLEHYRSFLMSNLKYLDAFAGDGTSRRIMHDGSLSAKDVDPRVGTKQHQLQQAAMMPWLDQNRFTPSEPKNGRYVIEGRLSIDDDCAWVAGDGISLGFALDPSLGATNSLRLSYRNLDSSDTPAQYLIMLNGATIGVGSFGDISGEVTHPIPGHALKRNNILRIQTFPIEGASLDRPKNLWGLSSLEFV
jgi:glycosyltransferase involved in cell wall biosynthesis